MISVLIKGILIDVLTAKTGQMGKVFVNCDSCDGTRWIVYWRPSDVSDVTKYIELCYPLKECDKCKNAWTPFNTLLGTCEKCDGEAWTVKWDYRSCQKQKHSENHRLRTKYAKRSPNSTGDWSSAQRWGHGGRIKYKDDDVCIDNDFTRRCDTWSGSKKKCTWGDDCECEGTGWIVYWKLGDRDSADSSDSRSHSSDSRAHSSDSIREKRRKKRKREKRKREKEKKKRKRRKLVPIGSTTNDLANASGLYGDGENKKLVTSPASTSSGPLEATQPHQAAAAAGPEPEQDLRPRTSGSQKHIDANKSDRFGALRIFLIFLACVAVLGGVGYAIFFKGQDEVWDREADLEAQEP